MIFKQLRETHTEPPSTLYSEPATPIGVCSNVPEPSTLILNLLPQRLILVWFYLLSQSHLSIFFLPPWNSYLRVGPTSSWSLASAPGLGCRLPQDACFKLSWVIIHMYLPASHDPSLSLYLCPLSNPRENQTVFNIKKSIEHILNKYFK